MRPEKRHITPALGRWDRVSHKALAMHEELPHEVTTPKLLHQMTAESKGEAEDRTKTMLPRPQSSDHLEVTLIPSPHTQRPCW